MNAFIQIMSSSDYIYFTSTVLTLRTPAESEMAPRRNVWTARTWKCSWVAVTDLAESSPGGKRIVERRVIIRNFKCPPHCLTDILTAGLLCVSVSTNMCFPGSVRMAAQLRYELLRVALSLHGIFFGCLFSA